MITLRKISNGLFNLLKTKRSAKSETEEDRFLMAIVISLLLGIILLYWGFFSFLGQPVSDQNLTPSQELDLRGTDEGLHTI